MTADCGVRGAQVASATVLARAGEGAGALVVVPLAGLNGVDTWRCAEMKSKQSGTVNAEI